MLVKDVMNKKVIYVKSESNVKDVASIMVDNNIGCAVVKKNDKVVGIVTDRDILTKIAKNDLDITSTPVEDIMTRYVIYTSPDTALEKAASLMIGKNVKKLPVLKNDRLVGIITTTDIVTASPAMLKEIRKLMLRKIK